MSEQFRLYLRDENPSGTACLLLLHGLGVTGDSWQLQIPALLRAGFRVIAPDIRGFGRSAQLPPNPAISAMAADIAALCAQLQIRAVPLVGISMGGTIALQTALDYPELVARLILVNTFACLRPASRRHWSHLLLRFFLAHLISMRRQATLVAQNLFPGPDQEYLRQALIEQVLQANARSYRGVTRSLARFDVRARLKELQMPVLVISGEYDRTVPLDCQKQLALGIPNARHVIIPDAGHGLIIEKPDEFNSVLLDFLEVPQAEIRHAI